MLPCYLLPAKKMYIRIPFSFFLSMIISIQRILTKGELTEGQLIIDGRQICDTLENSQACLKTGHSYPLCLVKCRQFGRKMICVGKKQACEACVKQQEVSYNTCLPRCCTLLKPGNGIHGRREGHILVGTRGARGLLIHPRMAFDSLYGRIRKSLERGHSVTLEIKEDRL